MGRLLAAALGLGLLALSGCSGDADPVPAPPHSSHTPSPTASPTPTAPVMPEAAKAHTEAGAKAFVEYFWEVVNYAQATGDTEAIGSLSDSSCTGCNAGIDSIDAVYRKGGAIVGGAATVSHIRVTFGWVKRSAVADATFEVALAPQVVRYPTSEHPGKARRSRDKFTLFAEPGSSWRVTDFRVAQ